MCEAMRAGVAVHCIVLQCTGSFGGGDGSGDGGGKSHKSHTLSSFCTVWKFDPQLFPQESLFSLYGNSNRICWIYFMCSPERELIKKLSSGKPFQKKRRS